MIGHLLTKLKKKKKIGHTSKKGEKKKSNDINDKELITIVRM